MKKPAAEDKFYLQMEKLIGGVESRQLIDAMTAISKRSVRYNRLSVATADLKGEVVPWCQPYGRFWQEERLPSRTLDYAVGRYYIQESSAMLAVSVAAKIIDFSNKIVLDLTAAPGGKATQVAELLSTGYLVANEINKNRIKGLIWNINRHRLSNVIVTSVPTNFLLEALPQFFDVIMVDAPCSGEGLFQRKKQFIKNWSKTNVRGCARRQKFLLIQAGKLLKPGGYMVYSTCTFSREENEDQIEYLLSQGFDAVELAPHLSVSPAISENQLVKSCSRRIFPHREGGAGAFVGVMQKKTNP